MSKIKSLTLMATAIILILIVATASGCGSTGDYAPQDAGVSETTKSATSIDRTMAQIHLGMREADVLEIAGKPTDTQHDEVQYVGTTDCWYYGDYSSTMWQLCFTNRVLDSKSRY